ncbi:hypothetical protein PIB30_018321 [Stylosanthes scabra]|uniref:RRM domain-containing protein n=1 Tax=Stylosanthes scabra TaxID=79078 RepID=A0ABU6Z6W9_9FABA|nr:hypothetical protein [Stylosanthes scabra]
MSGRVRAGGVYSERGKHSEVNTRGLSGVGSREYESGVHTIFLDNLPRTVMKGELFKEFFGYEIIKDVFVSRKRRRNRNGLFAFIRFEELDSVRSAVTGMNGVWWQGRKLHVTMSRFRRNQGGRLQYRAWKNNRRGGQETTIAWTELDREWTNKKKMNSNGQKI